MKKLFFIFIGVLLAGTILIAGCGKESEMAKSGDTVRVHYTGTLDDGTQFDSSAGREPLEFTLGAQQVIPGFENAVLGMRVGETRTVTIPSDEAYGPRRDDLVFTVGRESLAEGLEPAVGDSLQMTQSNGTIMMVTVVEVTDITITVDANLGLAGEGLTFEIELVEIK